MNTLQIKYVISSLIALHWTDCCCRSAGLYYHSFQRKSKCIVAWVAFVLENLLDFISLFQDSAIAKHNNGNTGTIKM